MTVPSPRLVAERGGVRLVIMPHSQPGIGDNISDPRSKRLIDGIEIEPTTQHPDDRGMFAELFRFGQPGIARDYDPANGARIQVSFTISYPGVIKAIHYHFEQTDLWAPLTGMFQVFLCDLRENSPTCGKLNTIFVGSQRPWNMRIPPGIGHGYRIVGPDSGMLVYATNRTYNPQDEGRIQFDDPGINYDWATRPK
jgi:dTDP-4-dehydrorhamnose 3,5-epimerase